MNKNEIKEDFRVLDSILLKESWSFMAKLFAIAELSLDEEKKLTPQDKDILRQYDRHVY